MPRFVTVRHVFLSHVERARSQHLKYTNIPAPDEVLGEKDVTQSDLMDIGQTFFYSENILSPAPVQHLSQETSNTELPAPPPPLRISTWISIIVALVSKCSCGRLSPRKCHRSEATQDIA